MILVLFLTHIEEFTVFRVLRQSFCGKFKIFCGFWEPAKPAFRMYDYTCDQCDYDCDHCDYNCGHCDYHYGQCDYNYCDYNYCDYNYGHHDYYNCDLLSECFPDATLTHF